MNRLGASLLLCVLLPVRGFANPPAIGTTQVFASLGGKVGAGIICDNNGHMFVSRNGELLVTTADGHLSRFADLADLPRGKDYFYPSPLIWDMAFDKDGTILAAAQDRIVRIAHDGSVTTLVREDFEGSMGACGLALDKDYNLYVAAGTRVFKYTWPNLDKSVVLDTSKSPVTLTWEGQAFDLNLTSLISLAFDPKKEHLYVSDLHSSTLLKYPLLSDNSLGKPSIVFDAYTDDLSQAPLNVCFAESGSIYISNDISSQILKMTPDGQKTVIEIPGKLKNHFIAFGGQGFESGWLYFTTYSGDNIYRTYVGETAAGPR